MAKDINAVAHKARTVAIEAEATYKNSLARAKSADDGAKQANRAFKGAKKALKAANKAARQARIDVKAAGKVYGKAKAKLERANAKISKAARAATKATAKVTTRKGEPKGGRLEKDASPPMQPSVPKAGNKRARRKGGSGSTAAPSQARSTGSEGVASREQKAEQL